MSLEVVCIPLSVGELVHPVSDLAFPQHNHWLSLREYSLQWWLGSISLLLEAAAEFYNGNKAYILVVTTLFRNLVQILLSSQFSHQEKSWPSRVPPPCPLSVQTNNWNVYKNAELQLASHLEAKLFFKHRFIHCFDNFYPVNRERPSSPGLWPSMLLQWFKCMLSTYISVLATLPSL